MPHRVLEGARIIDHPQRDFTNGEAEPIANIGRAWNCRPRGVEQKESDIARSDRSVAEPKQDGSPTTAGPESLGKAPPLAVLGYLEIGNRARPILNCESCGVRFGPVYLRRVYRLHLAEIDDDPLGVQGVGLVGVVLIEIGI